MTREKILLTATNLYSRYGIKSVSMDQLANELKMSKRTLYMEFESKDDLVAECMEREFYRIEKFAAKTKSESSCALEAIVQICTGVSTHTSSVCPAFFKDLQRYLDADRIHEQYKVAMCEESNTLLEQGIEEGDIVAGINLRLIMSILIEQISHLKPVYNPPVIMTLLRGICTPQGLEKLDRYTNQAKESEVKI